MDASAWPEENWVRLGELIAKHRRARGWDQQELAQRSGNSPNTISNYERGRATKSRRIPLGLGRVEQVLRWPRGAAAKILEGQDPEAALSEVPLPGMSQDELDMSNETTPGGGGPPAVHEGAAGTAYLTAEARASLIATLPEPIRRRLRDVLSFGRACVEFGAPPWVASAYDNAVNGLLLAVLNGPGEQSEAILVSYLEDSPARPWSNAMQSHLLGPALARRLGKLPTSDARHGDAEGEGWQEGERRLFLSEPWFSANKTLRDSVRGVMEQERIRKRIMSVQGQLLSKNTWGKPEVRENLENELHQLEKALQELQSE